MEAQIYKFIVVFEFPNGFKELRVLEEKLTVGSRPVYSREVAEVHLARSGREKEADFRIDWHMVALPIIQEQSTNDPIFVFKQWLARLIILRPIPDLISGESQEETFQPAIRLSDFGAWFSGLPAYAPSAYSKIDQYLKQVMPDLKDIKNPSVGKDSRSLVVQFSTERGSLNLPFEDLADGEKCFMVCALVLAANDAYGPLFCSWDEPDNSLAPAEVSHLVPALRTAFQAGGQFIATSHNLEVIRSFSDENTLVFRDLTVLSPPGSARSANCTSAEILINALVRGDVE